VNPFVILDARTATDHFPGIGRYVVNLASALSRIAPEARVSLLHDPTATATRLTLPDLPRVTCSISPFSIRQQWNVPRLLRQAQATLYHSPYYLMPYQPGVPTILTCYDLIPFIYPQYFSLSQRLIYHLAHILALGTARRVVAISRATQTDLTHFFRLDPQRVTVTPLAADTNYVPCQEGQIAAVRNKYVLPEKYVLYMGSNKPHKNLGRLIEAWKTANIKFQTLNFKLVVAGHWDNRYPEAQQHVEKLGLNDRVIFIGPVQEADLPPLYSGAELFVFPSLYEGFGLPVLEAMACGTPVVCSNTSSMPEVAGDAAILVNPLDVGALAEAIGRTLANKDLRQNMREKGLAQAAKFSWERAARETLAVYDRASKD
jgi:glycosyltransferase involved in cell wall biosynthesis